MDRIIDNRDSGKTFQLMLKAKEKNALFVCYNPWAMQRKAENYGITNLEFVQYYDFMRGMFNSEKTNYVIDELELFIKYWCNNNIKNHPLQFCGYTLSNED